MLLEAQVYLDAVRLRSIASDAVRMHGQPPQASFAEYENALMDPDAASYKHCIICTKPRCPHKVTWDGRPFRKSCGHTAAAQG